MVNDRSGGSDRFSVKDGSGGSDMFQVNDRSMKSNHPYGLDGNSAAN